MLDSEEGSWGRSNCNETKSCAAPGMQCYEQVSSYAQCKESCVAGQPDMTHWDDVEWSCKELGVRSEGEPNVCVKQGEDCSKSWCCSDAGLQCYQKNSSVAACKSECAPNGPDLSDADGKFWTCKELGERSPEAAEWVSQKCAKGGDSCIEKGCCANSGETCFKQNDYWGQCRTSCDPDYDQGWSCEQVGATTPGAAPGGSGIFAPWVMGQCSKPHEDCTNSHCCLGMGFQCYSKNEYFAMCEESCTPGPNKDDKGDKWACEPLGPRSAGLAIKGSPSLYCFSVVNPGSYEVDLMTEIHKKGAAIFACDHSDMVTADTTIDIDGVQTVQFQGAQVIGSVDGTAGNTELFVNAWEKVIEIGQWRDHAFTAKVDPDAVFIPEKLRWHLGDQVGTNMFIVNCEAWNMIYGSLEVFSNAAMEAWGTNHQDCNAPADFGEDKYMTQCMDTLGVTRVDDFAVVGDQLCGSFTDCRSLPNAAFHPFKDIGGWMDCWQTAMNVISG